VTAIPNESVLIQHELPVGEALELLRLVWAVDHALQRRSKSMAAVLGVTGPQRLVIRIIGRFPSIHARQLAEILHLHPSSLTALLKRLERRRLIRRRPDERDRRRWLLGLTRHGQAFNGDMPGTIEAALQRTLRSTAPCDLAGARIVLDTIARELDRGGALESEPRHRPARRPLRKDRRQSNRR
jgi:DNA-binding MarR family transcriptional regulator